MYGLKVPKAREWIMVRMVASLSEANSFLMTWMVSARFSASEALMLKKSALEPTFLISSMIRSTFGIVAARSKCTPKMFMPRRESSRAHAPPNPLEDPRTSAH